MGDGSMTLSFLGGGGGGGGGGGSGVVQGGEGGLPLNHHPPVTM